METQDHKKPNHSGHEGHGGVHVCHKCGWPFPNSHPSAKNRRAHKRVCGTVEGYRMDNNSSEKIHAEGSDGEHNSDDEHKTPSDKVVERTISKRSSSGVGSRSSRSTRSEDEVFDDAVTEFNDSPATATDNASDGALQRFYSMQNENDLDDSKHTEENPVADLLKNNQMQTVQTLEAENDKVEAGVQSQGHVTPSVMNHALDSVTMGYEDTVEQNMTQPSKQSSELDIVTREGKEILSNKDQSELSTSYGKAAEKVEHASVLGGASEECLDSASSGEMMKPAGMETSVFEDKIEKINEVDSPGRDKIESFHEVDSPGNFLSPVHLVEVIDSGNGNTIKSDIIEERGSKSEFNEDVYVLAVPDALVLQERPEIGIEDLDHKREKISILKAPDSTLIAESVEYSNAHAIEDGGSGMDFVRTADSVGVHSENVMEDMLKQEDEQKSSVVNTSFGEPDQISDLKVSNADINDFRSAVVVEDFEGKNAVTVSCSEEQKPIVSFDNVFPEGAPMGGGHVQETTSHGDSQYIDDGECFAARGNDGSEVLEDEIAVRSSMIAEPAIDEVTSQVKEVTNTHESYVTDTDDHSKVDYAVLNGNEMRIVGEEENESAHAETAPGYGSSIAGSRDSIDEPYKSERNPEHCEQDTILDSGDVKLDHSQAESITTNCVRGTESPGENGTDGVDQIDGRLDSTTEMSRSDIQVGKEAESPPQSSAAVNDSLTKKFAESTSVTESDRVTKQQTAVSAADTVVDSSSQTDSLEGNWGSISVKSAASDAQPATDIPASNNSQASVGEESTSLQPGPVIEYQQFESQTTVEPRAAIEHMEGVSEIQTSEEQQQKSSALQTGWSPMVSHVANEPHVGKSNEEMIAKVSNWSTVKQHTALKTLLGEATAKSRAESPIHPNHSSTSAPQMDEIPVTNNGFSDKTENVILNPEMEAPQKEMGKEWNSPARYPVNIKTEKRRAKSRPYWAPFLCCSSVNAR